MLPVLVYDSASFRASIPAYADTTAYPDSVVSGYFNFATNYVSDINAGALRDASRQLALNLLTAHLMTVANNVATNGGTGALVSSATIDKVSVTTQLPPGTSQFQYWLNLSPYGQQLLTLLSIKATGGKYVHGSPEIGAFRRLGGRFYGI